MGVQAEDVVRRYLFDMLKGGRVRTKTELAAAMNTSRNQLNIAMVSGSLTANQINGLSRTTGSVAAVYRELSTLAEKMARGVVPEKLSEAEEETLRGRADRIKFSAGQTSPPDTEDEDALSEPELPSRRPRRAPAQSMKR